MKRNGRPWRKLLLLLGGGLLLAVAARVGSRLVTADAIRPGDRGKINVFVSILPQKYFVERVGGERVSVTVMVGPGQNPATYEPLPQQMRALTEADLYFRIGVPFETAWIDRLQALNRELIIVDTREGVALRNGAGLSWVRRKRRIHVPLCGGLLIYIWLDPLQVKIQAETVYRALAAFDPGAGLLSSEPCTLPRRLDQLHTSQATFDRLSEALMVYHPAWGYLADRYGLKQVAQREGKNRAPLAQLIVTRKQDRMIFIQSQFNSAAAEAVARAVNGQVVSIDPLAEDYLTNMRRIAQAIKGSYDTSGESN